MNVEENLGKKKTCTDEGREKSIRQTRQLGLQVVYLLHWGMQWDLDV